MELPPRNSFGSVRTMTFVYGFAHLRETFEARASEFALSATILSLGIICFVNSTLFLGSAFGGLRIWADQDTWGFIMVTVGAGRIAVLFINGHWWRTPLFRSVFAFLSCYVWFQLLKGTAVNVSFGLAIFPWLFGLDAYNSLRAGKESGVAQYLHIHKKKAKQRHAGSRLPNG